MNEQDQTPTPSQPATTDSETLVKIERHLSAIKSILQFFLMLAILSIVLAGCNLVLGM